jgi:hypothetical protein
MSKHTPGPWDQIVKMDGFTAVGANTLIARVFSTAFKDLENEKANARLIAAAPDMYRALELIINSDMAQREEDEGEISTELSIVRAAIAKAEGKP